MWIWFLCAFLLIATWVGGYFFGLAPNTEILISVVIVALLVGVLLLRRWRAGRAARQLEREILRQAEQQAANARPDRRAEIVELRLQLQRGIDSLKKTKLGRASGAQALYGLPWYMIMGPPGAGKTTALKQSGLQFPYQDPSGGSGALKGVGGTRNCDWWLTNEAILLDTAGRYATERDDHEEWTAFLDMLKRFRAEKPINGVLLAISIADLAQSSEEQVDEYASKLRARIDEVITRLEMVVPIYVLFTKCDLVAGFVEFWGNLRKNERGQVWGATFPLDADMSEPGKAVEAEFDLLAESVHARGIQRLGGERDAETRHRVYQFPLEFRTLRDNVAQFAEALFKKNTFQETPIFRGFYFTSGTQEGRPMDRVLGSMARAFGLRPQPTEAVAQQTESKSYFLGGLLRSIVFPDQHVAARTTREIRRQRVRKASYALAALAIAVVLIVPSSCTFSRNRDLVKSTDSIVTNASKVDWTDSTPLGDKAMHLDELAARLRQLDDWHRDGAPMTMRWGMYTGDRLYAPTRDAYVGRLQVGFVDPARKFLIGHLQSVDATSISRGEGYSRTYNELKAYLMMTALGKPNLDATWVSTALTRAWIAAAHTTDTEALEAQLLPHVKYYVELYRRGEVPAWNVEMTLVPTVRAALLQVPKVDREYDALVRDANTNIPAIRFDTIFYGTTAPYVSSAKTTEVPGAYTKLGWERVRKLIEQQQDTLTAERWVLGEEEKRSKDEIQKQMTALRTLYFERYKGAWRDFLQSIEVAKPDNATLALDEYNALSEPEWPYLRLLRTLSDNVTLEMAPPSNAVVDQGKGLVDKGVKMGADKLGIDAGVAPLAKQGRPMSPVEIAFKPLTRFAVPDVAPKEGDPPAQTPLAQYQAILAKLVGSLSDLKDSKTPPDPKALGDEFQTAFRATSTLLADQDGFTRPLLSPLLMRPITFGWNAVLHDAGGAASALWEVNVWQRWNTQLEKKYPFDPNAQMDASVQDFTEFFKPKGGVLWGYYDQHLKGTLDKEGDTFIPSRRMKGSVAYSGTFLKCLSRANEVTKQDFVVGQEGAFVQFDVNLHSVSPDVSDVTFAVDGAEKKYRNEPEEWLTVRWPAAAAEVRGGRVRVRGANGLDEEIVRTGDFGLFRLLDAATLTTGTPSATSTGAPTLVATWELKTQPGSFVKMNIKPARNEHPLNKDRFKGIICPRNIVASGG
jgi:type VI secretion system protein ImpL